MALRISYAALCEAFSLQNPCVNVKRFRMPATNSKSSEAYKITLRLLALMPRLMSTCKICGVIKLVSVTTSKLVKAPNVTGQYFRKYPRARQRSPIASRLSTAIYHLLRLLIQTQQVIQTLQIAKLLNRSARHLNEITRPP